jgi:Fe-S cluster assembly protein SufD
MIELLDKASPFAEHFKQRHTELASAGPSALQAVREKALKAWQQVGFPTHKDEEWKYTSLRDLAEGSYAPSYAADVCLDELESLAVGSIGQILLTFVNGRFSPGLSDLSHLPHGVKVCSLQDAIQNDWSLVEPHLTKIGTLEGKLGSTNDERFSNLNTAFLAQGAFVHVPRGVVVEDPVHILYLHRGDKGEFVTHPRTLIVAEEASQVKLLESYVGLEGKYFTNAVTEVFVARNAMVEHVRFQQETRGAFHIGLLAIHQEADSTYTSYNTSFGAQIGRTDVNLWLNGEHTESRLDGVYVASGTQVLDNKTRIDHAKANCHSFEVYKGILAGRGTGVFNGKIFVYEDAQKTDAKQTNQALLLSPTATINTKPQLEIFADDVKCTHGATVGQLRKDAMFYLRARGIPEKEAKALLVYAFAADVLERISVESIREALEKVLYKKLHEDTDLETTEELPVEG